MHLEEEELVDLAEGTRPESSAPHLASCEPCRRQVRDLRAMMSAAADVGLPEPSPLYWDHLSARVRETVATEASPQPWLDAAAWRRVLMPAWAAAVASIIIVVALSSRLIAPPPPAAPAAAVVKDAEVVDLWNDRASDDDESLTLVASLSAGLDLEAAGEAGLAARGSAEHAVTLMDLDDLRELKRLLMQELAPSGD
jgi:hypothetical protein